jgi:hypothetical protein
MKFRSSIVAAAVAVAGMQFTDAFAPSASLASRQSVIASSKNGLQMVATNNEVEVEVVEEVKAKKTREVSIKLSPGRSGKIPSFPIISHIVSFSF